MGAAWAFESDVVDGSTSLHRNHILVEFLCPICARNLHTYHGGSTGTLLSVHHMLRDRSKPVGGVCLGDILYRRSSFFTAAARVCFQLAIISKLVSVKPIAVFIGDF